MERTEIDRGGSIVIKILFSICGRGGSKGVKNKNIRTFLNAPLIHYSLVDAYLAFNDINKEIEKHVIVDSDSDLILETAASFLPSIYVHKREAQYAGDNVAKNLAISAALDDFEKNVCLVDCVIDLDITSPLRTVKDIENIFELYQKGNNDIVFSVVPARRNPYFNMVERLDNHTQLCKKVNFTCRQDTPPVYEMNASIYAYRPECLRNSNSIFENLTDCVEMKDYGVLDIDNEHDFELMELVYAHIAERDDEYYSVKRQMAQGGSLS